MCMWHTIMHIRTRPCAPSCAGMSGYNAIPAGSKTMNNHEPDAPPLPSPPKGRPKMLCKATHCTRHVLVNSRPPHISYAEMTKSYMIVANTLTQMAVN